MATQTIMGVHFWNQHVRYTVVILEEVNLPQLHCPLCNMLLPWRSLNISHKRTAHWKKGKERKRLQLVVVETVTVTSRAFSAYGAPSI